MTEADYDAIMRFLDDADAAAELGDVPTQVRPLHVRISIQWLRLRASTRLLNDEAIRAVFGEDDGSADDPAQVQCPATPPHDEPTA